jgi:putative tryptophan/tyrosine transport system substrate-binding protein
MARITNLLSPKDKTPTKSDANWTRAHYKRAFGIISNKSINDMARIRSRFPSRSKRTFVPLNKEEFESLKEVGTRPMRRTIPDKHRDRLIVAGYIREVVPNSSGVSALALTGAGYKAFGSGQITDGRHVCFFGRYWGQSGHGLLRRTCLLMTQSGHEVFWRYRLILYDAGPGKSREALMKRRDFITLLAGMAPAWPFAAWAQQPRKPPIIGFLGATTPSVQSQWTAAFVQRLRELGWIEGRTVLIEYRWAEGSDERAVRFASELVALKVDIIVTSGTPAALAVKRATSVIPIVFASVGDPVGAGLVANLAQPGGNVTGLSNLTTDLGSKRLELVREMIPHLRRVAVLANAGNPVAMQEMAGVQATGPTLNLEVSTFEIRRPEDIGPVFDTLKNNADVLYVVFDPLTNTNRVSINTLALAARLPVVSSFQEYVEAGCLMSYGPNLPGQFRRAAEYVDKILHGAKPGDIPVEQPTKFNFVINLTTARAIGLTVPPSLLTRADQVIE